MNSNTIIIILTIIIVVLYIFNGRLRRKLSDMQFSYKSQSVKYGKMTEQFMPFLQHYPYDAQNFRFLGTPIDGVQFNEDSIVFIEFKAASSTLNGKQRYIKDLIAKNKISFEEIRI